MRQISHVLIRAELAVISHQVDGSYSEPSFMAAGRHDYDGCFERDGKRYLRFRLRRMPCVLDVVEDGYLRSCSRRKKIIYYQS